MYVCVSVMCLLAGLPITREQVIKWAEQLMSTIDGIIDNINNIEGIAPALRAIGVRAAIVGAQLVHFELLESCLLELVQEVNEAEWTGRFEAAWTCGMEAIVAIIKPAMEQANRERAVIVKVGCSPTKKNVHGLSPLVNRECVCISSESLLYNPPGARELENH